jgi:signal transduction histidine kinase
LTIGRHGAAAVFLNLPSPIFNLKSRSAPVPGKAVGRAAVDLPWLCPNTDSLIGLAEQPARLPGLSAADPALLAFLFRFGPVTQNNSAFWITPDRFQSPSLPELAAAYLSAAPVGWVDPTAPVVAQLQSFSAVAAGLARRLAACTPTVSADAAAGAARLAPLGWYAVAAVNPKAAASCLFEPAFRLHPDKTQAALWGLDHDAIARRLAVRWRLPGWLGSVLGALNLPLRATHHAVADPELFAVVQLAVHEAELRTTDLGLTRHGDRAEVLAHLGLAEERCELVFRSPVEQSPGPTPSALDPDPRKVALVRNLLLMAGESRRRNGASLVVRLEERADELHRALADLSHLSSERIRVLKLAALAELAAGAGHEINNPLAVISGNAQQLLRTEQDPGREDSLRLIVRQTQRISTILRDLMQFARPPRPEKQRFPASEVITAVRNELTPFAADRGVRFELANAPADSWLEADPRQLRHAVAAVARNGIEAAPKGGWVRLGCEPAAHGVAFVVEDSGPGLDEDTAEHAFDPFFCGRAAGRGRGLGLPTAWRLARENGGDVRHETVPGGPTRFVVVVPKADPPAERTERMTA